MTITALVERELESGARLGTHAESDLRWCAIVAYRENCNENKTAIFTGRAIELNFYRKHLEC